MSALVPWAWRGLDATEASASWMMVSSFVDWLVCRYDLGDLVPRCWFLHGAITEELTALWASWSNAYLDPEAEADAPIIWHERFALCRIRLSEWDRLGCAQRGHRDDLPTEWQPDAAGFAAFVEQDLKARAGKHRLHTTTATDLDEANGESPDDTPFGDGRSETGTVDEDDPTLSSEEPTC